MTKATFSLADGLHGFKYFLLVRSGNFYVEFCTYQFFYLIFFIARKLKVAVSNLILKNTLIYIYIYIYLSLSLCVSWRFFLLFSSGFYLSLSLFPLLFVDAAHQLLLCGKIASITLTNAEL